MKSFATGADGGRHGADGVRQETDFDTAGHTQSPSLTPTSGAESMGQNQRPVLGFWQTDYIALSPDQHLEMGWRRDLSAPFGPMEIGLKEVMALAAFYPIGLKLGAGGGVGLMCFLPAPGQVLIQRPEVFHAYPFGLEDTGGGVMRLRVDSRAIFPISHPGVVPFFTKEGRISPALAPILGLLQRQEMFFVQARAACAPWSNPTWREPLAEHWPDGPDVGEYALFKPEALLDVTGESIIRLQQSGGLGVAYGAQVSRAHLPRWRASWQSFLTHGPTPSHSAPARASRVENFLTAIGNDLTLY